MDTNKNTYTVIYTIVLVAVVATILAVVSIGLKPKQQENIKVEKQMNILGCDNLAAEAKTASNKNAYIQDEFKKYITGALVVNTSGEVLESFDSDIDNCNAFKVSPADQFDLMRKIDGTQDQAAKDAMVKDLRLPVFICSNPDGTKHYILSGYGAGLWGPIWSYIAVKEDGKIAGALFDHASETPGLGGEIVTDKFRSQFTGKVILSDGEIIPVTVVKGGNANAEANEINAISGATITSKAVQTMISNWMNYYKPYLQKVASRAAHSEAPVEVENPNEETIAEQNSEQTIKTE